MMTPTAGWTSGWNPVSSLSAHEFYFSPDPSSAFRITAAASTTRPPCSRDDDENLRRIWLGHAKHVAQPQTSPTEAGTPPCEGLARGCSANRNPPKIEIVSARRRERRRPRPWGSRGHAVKLVGRPLKEWRQPPAPSPWTGWGNVQRGQLGDLVEPWFS